MKRPDLGLLSGKGLTSRPRDRPVVSGFENDIGMCQAAMWANAARPDRTHGLAEAKSRMTGLSCHGRQGVIY